VIARVALISRRREDGFDPTWGVLPGGISAPLLARREVRPLRERDEPEGWRYLVAGSPPLTSDEFPGVRQSD
jgi:hypothetical protein